MQVELWNHLVHHATAQGRSASALLQRLLWEGLRQLDEDDRVQEVLRNDRELLRRVPPTELPTILRRQQALLARLEGKDQPLPALPPSLQRPRPGPRRRRRVATRRRKT